MTAPLVPMRLRTFLRRSVRDLTLRRRLWRFSVAASDAVHRRHPGREAWRSYRSSVHTLITVYRLRPPPVATHAMTRDELLRWMAEAGVKWMRTPGPKDGRTTFHTSIFIRRFVGLMRTVVAGGVFVHIGRPIERTEVWARMLDLARTEPEHWSFFQPKDVATLQRQHHQHKQRTEELTEEVLERILACGACTARDRLMITVLYTTGIRVEAVSSLRWSQLWNEVKAAPATAFTVMEKGSRPRTVAIDPAVLGKAVVGFAETLSSSARPPPVFCFESRHGRQPTIHTLSNRLHAVCKDAGVPAVTPHAFRRFVVNHAMRNGASLPEVSAFIGHETTAVTYRYYWTDDVAQRVNAVLDRPESDRLDEMRAELAALQQQIAETEAELKRLEDAQRAESTARRDEPLGPDIDAILRAVA